MKSLFSLFSFIVFLNCYAQEPVFDIKYGNRLSDSYKNSYVVYSNTDGSGGSYMVRVYKKGVTHSGGGYLLEHYNTAMQLVKSFEFPQADFTYQKYKMFMGTVQNGSKITMLDIYYNVKEKAYMCMAHTADFVTGEYKDVPLFTISRDDAAKMGIMQLKKVFYVGPNSINDNSPIAFTISAAKTAFAVMLAFHGKEQRSFRVYSFDAGLNNKLEYTVSRDITEKPFSFSNICIDDTGSKVYLFSNEWEKNKVTQGCTLTEISATGEKNTRFKNEIPAGENIKLFVKGDRLIGTGLYKEPGYEWYNGVSYFEINREKLDVVKIKHTPFTDEIINDKKAGTFTNYNYPRNIVFKDPVITPGNDILMSAEEFSVYEPNPGPGGVNQYYFNDIICYKINGATGNAEWIRNIEKSQYGRNVFDGAFSYATSYSKNGILTFFLNIDKDITVDKKKGAKFRSRNEDESDLTVINFDNAGQMTYDKIIYNSQELGPYMSGRGIINPDELYFLSANGKYKQLVKVNIIK